MKPYLFEAALAGKIPNKPIEWKCLDCKAALFKANRRYGQDGWPEKACIMCGGECIPVEECEMKQGEPHT